MTEVIRRLVEKCTDNNKIYLLSSIDEVSGFFCLNKKVIFMKKACEINKSENIKTEKLSLLTGIKVNSISNDASFKAGLYDYILFDGNLEEIDFESFIKICLLYEKEDISLSLRDFFFSLLEMFQLPKEQQFKNLLGLYGELCVLKDIYDDRRICIASGWHEKSTDKYDINYKNKILEVKTTTSELYIVKIKHDQLFGRKGVILAAVRVIESNAGITLQQLVENINKIPEFSGDFHFQLELGKELKRISSEEAENKKFELKGIKYYRNIDISTIGEIPENITGIEYNCILIETPEIRPENIF